MALAAAVGTAAGLGITMLTGVPVWPFLGAVTGVGVGDLLADGRR